MEQQTLKDASKSDYKRLLLRQWADLGTMVIPSQKDNSEGPKENLHNLYLDTL